MYVLVKIKFPYLNESIKHRNGTQTYTYKRECNLIILYIYINIYTIDIMYYNVQRYILINKFHCTLIIIELYYIAYHNCSLNCSIQSSSNIYKYIYIYHIDHDHGHCLPQFITEM